MWKVMDLGKSRVISRGFQNKDEASTWLEQHIDTDDSWEIAEMSEEEMEEYEDELAEDTSDLLAKGSFVPELDEDELAERDDDFLHQTTGDDESS